MSIKQTIDDTLGSLVRDITKVGFMPKSEARKRLNAFTVEVIKAVRDEVKLMPGGYIEVGSVKEAEGYTKKQKEVDDKLNTIIKELEG